MFIVNSDKSIYLTRGDAASLIISADGIDGEVYTFVTGDIIRFRVFKKNRHDDVVIQKDVEIEVESQTAEIMLTKDDTKIGEIINKPIDYWYEIELNPETIPQTIVGYDSAGPKVFRLFPEGGDLI